MSTAVAEQPSLLDTLHPAHHADVYSVYDSLRTPAGVVWDERIRAWLVTDHRLVTAALSDRRLSSIRYPDITAVDETLRPLVKVLSEQLFYLDDPDHSRLRSLLNKAFTARSVSMLREQIERTVNRMIAELHGREVIDVIGDIAYPLPVTVICDLLDVPEDMRVAIKNWSSSVAVVMGRAQPSDEELHAGVDGMQQMIEYLETLLAVQRRTPTSAVFRSLLDGDVSDDEILANAAALLLVGHETTTNLIGNGMLALLQNETQRALLLREPHRIKEAIEEMLRFDCSVQNLLRRATEDVMIGETRVEAGSTVLLVLGAANRDEKAYAQPHQFDITREGPRHVAFGHGPHFCIGAVLARLEAEIVIPALLEGLPGLKLSERPLEWHSSLTFRGLRSLEVVHA